MSHETIYRSLFVQARGGLRKELTTCLRSGRTRRRPHKRTQLSRSGRLKDMVLISERPAEAADRAVPGHWEGDLIIGKGSHSAIGTLVERSSRYVMLLRLPNGRTAEDVRIALTRQISKLPTQLRRSLTWDQGKEMAEHVRFSIDSKIDVYFCDPHSPGGDPAADPVRDGSVRDQGVSRTVQRPEPSDPHAGGRDGSRCWGAGLRRA